MKQQWNTVAYGTYRKTRRSTAASVASHHITSSQDLQLLQQKLIIYLKRVAAVVAIHFFGSMLRLYASVTIFS